MSGVNLKDFPQAKEGTLILIVSLYRELHNRAKGKQCMCGACQMVQKLLVEQLGINLTLDSSKFTGGSMEEAMRCLELAKEGSV
jgi:hypothetical protein